MVSLYIYVEVIFKDLFCASFEVILDVHQRDIMIFARHTPILFLQPDEKRRRINVPSIYDVTEGNLSEGTQHRILLAAVRRSLVVIHSPSSNDVSET